MRAGVRRTVAAAVVVGGLLAGAAPAHAAAVDPVPAQLTVSLGGCTVAGAVTAATATVDATHTSAVCATVQNAAGTALPGVPVSVKVDRGFVSTSASPASTPTTTSTAALTDTDGHATAYAGSTASGRQTVTVTAGTLSRTATIDYAPGKAASISISPTSASIPAGEGATFTATVKDAFGNPAHRDGDNSYNAVFFVPDGPILDGPGSSSQEAYTDTDGRASLTLYVSPGRTGSGTVTVSPLTYSTSTAPSATATYTVVRGAAETVTVSGVQPVVVRNVEHLKATVTGSGGKPLAGAQVLFRVTTASGTSTESGTTGTDGVATLDYRTQHAGGLLVTAVAGSVTSSAVSTTVSPQPVTYRVGGYSPSAGRVTLVALVSPASQVVADSVVHFYERTSAGVRGPIRVEVDGGRAQVTLSRPSGQTRSFYATIEDNPDVVTSQSATFSVRAK